MPKQPTPLQTREQSINNNPCVICRGMKFPPPCKGHGGKGSGKASDSDADQAFEEDAKSTQGSGPSPQLKPDPLFMLKVLTDVLQNTPLVVTQDQATGKLTIQCDASLLNVDEQAAVDAYANLILQELDEFKEKHQIEKPCYQLELDNNGHLKTLTITLPTPGLYDAFIQQLNDKKLLPDQNKKFPTPTPSSARSKKEDKTEEQKTSWQPPKPSPFKE